MNIVIGIAVAVLCVAVIAWMFFLQYRAVKKVETINVELVRAKQDICNIAMSNLSSIEKEREYEKVVERIRVLAGEKSG
jgi:hypothetical protein